MLKKHSQAFLTLTLATDAAVTAGAWILAYFIRVHSGLLPLDRGKPEAGLYLAVLPVAAVISVFCYRWAGLYRPRREGSPAEEILLVVKGTFFALAALLALSFFYREYEYSRAVVLIFAILNPLLLGSGRFGARLALRALRSRGLNLRKAVIVGAGKPGQKLAEAIRRNPWTGIEVTGFVDHRPERLGRTYAGVPVLGAIADLPSVILRSGADQVFIALTGRDYGMIEEIMGLLSETMADVRVVPDMFSFHTLDREVEEFDGLPVVSLRESPLYGWNMVVKRGVDAAFSAAVLCALSPLFLLIAALVKLTSPGPVFYRQERMGLGGDVFRMYKFRSMRKDAEAATGAVWAVEDDPRRTRFGSFLRRTSLDELPQFVNVLLGDMSVVGPRPERPVFIGEFRKKIPRYMLRHKMKAGITGWAQVNGFRGNTSLRKRIQFDLYYIEHWTIRLDAWIMFLTVFRVLAGRNAY